MPAMQKEPFQDTHSPISYIENEIPDVVKETPN